MTVTTVHWTVTCLKHRCLLLLLETPPLATPFLCQQIRVGTYCYHNVKTMQGSAFFATKRLSILGLVVTRSEDLDHTKPLV